MAADRKQAKELTKSGIGFLDAGDYEPAIALFTKASIADDSYYSPWFHLGLAHKFTRRWPEALDCFEKAFARMEASLSDEHTASVAWNLGIAASKMSAWELAARAWHLLGNVVKRSPDGSPTIPMGLAWVSRQGFAPALGERIDPARVRITATGDEDTGLRVGDIVVHDGSRIDSRQHAGELLPVFPVL